ncbi:DNA mismatch repair protein MutS [Desulfovibrio sp. OttesenSCG-928-A18]|nr:DNA mismatch repair protein MutS [Desulfovibrio sp. OttesenSCG-928-A18]
MSDSTRTASPRHPAPHIPPEQITPMFAQYLAIKKEHEDALLFYRMGDFYELFFDDAIVASKALQITLTSRNSQAENPVPMCGVPHHSVENYINELMEQGFHVAVCDQMEDPRAAKGIVKRGVTLVRTPSTTVEDAGLEAKGHNYLGALYWDREKGNGGVAWLEYSTGEWSGLFSKREADLWQWAQKMQPRELLLPDLPAELFRVPESLGLSGITPIFLPLRIYFDLKNAETRILEAQKVQELGALGLKGKDGLIRACGALLGYLMQTQKQAATHIKTFTPLDLGRHLVIDEISERNLEIFRRLDGRKGRGTLRRVLDETITPMGGRLLEERLRHPWRELEPIAASADAVQFFYEQTHKRAALREALDAVFDLERLSTRIELGRSTPRDFVAMGQSLACLAGVQKALEASPPGLYPSAEDVNFPPLLHSLYSHWDSLEDLGELLLSALVDSPPPTITEGGLFKAGYNSELDALLDLVENGEQKLQALLAREQREHALPRLKLGYNRVFGYYFELPKTQAQGAPEHFSRRQTVANAERYISPELKELEDAIMAAGESRKKLEYTLFQQLREHIKANRERVLFMAEALAGLDFWQGLAECAAKRDWKRPQLHTGTDIHIRQGRHPVVEDMAGPSGFVPNDLHMDAKRRVLIITGPNMAGKSTVLRQAAIIVLLAQMGSYVPAADASIGLADRIFSRVGASDNLAQGQSTFMVEMMESARILRQAGSKSLIILDEIGRGTSTFDGLSLAWAVVENLAGRSEGKGGSKPGIRTLFATHYHELTALEGRIPGVHNMNIAIREHGGEIVFLRRLVPGPSDRSYGIEVAKLAGVPMPVVQRARQILSVLESTRAADAGAGTAEAVQQLLPGLSGDAAQAPGPRHPALLPPEEEKAAHPLFTILGDIDTDNLTPMQALALIIEWKQLWGGED